MGRYEDVPINPLATPIAKVICVSNLSSKYGKKISKDIVPSRYWRRTLIAGYAFLRAVVAAGAG